MDVSGDASFSAKRLVRCTQAMGVSSPFSPSNEIAYAEMGA